MVVCADAMRRGFGYHPSRGNADRPARYWRAVMAVLPSGLLSKMTTHAATMNQGPPMTDHPRKRAKRRGMKPSIPDVPDREAAAQLQGEIAFWEDIEETDNPYDGTDNPLLRAGWAFGWHKAQNQAIGESPMD
jgi:hypothetical protein